MNPIVSLEINALKKICNPELNELNMDLTDKNVSKKNKKLNQVLCE